MSGYSGGYRSFAYFYDALTENISYRERAEYFDSLIKRHGGRKNILLEIIIPSLIQSRGIIKKCAFAV